MYPSATEGDRVPDERERLLELTAQYLLEHGVLDLSLRTLGDAVDSSHRVLLYYFHSREQLVTEALDEAARLSSVRDAALLGPSGTDADVQGELVRVWRLISAPDQLPLIRLFLQVVALALHNPEPYAAFLDGLQTEWLGAYAGYLEEHGVPGVEASDVAAEIVGLQRGLQLELAIGGSAEAIDRAFTAAAGRWAERVAAFR
jgi:AcrR family transcriptional regulator